LVRSRDLQYQYSMALFERLGKWSQVRRALSEILPQVLRPRTHSTVIAQRFRRGSLDFSPNSPLFGRNSAEPTRPARFRRSRPLRVHRSAAAILPRFAGYLRYFAAIRLRLQAIQRYFPAHSPPPAHLDSTDSPRRSHPSLVSGSFSPHFL
jgi:hypothetical protein